jgi:hypothetical protein
MCQQQKSDGASLWEEMACPMTNIQPEVGLERLVDLSTISYSSTPLPLFYHTPSSLNKLPLLLRSSLVIA